MPARITPGYLALVAVLGAHVFLVPDLGGPLWAVIGALTVGAILYGVRQHAPLSRAPWLLLAGAIATMALGDALYAVDPQQRGAASVVAEACYLALFPLIATGLLLMTRSSVVLADRSRMLDLLTFTCAAALVSWAVVVSPTLGAAGLSSLDRSLLAAYALGDLLVLIASVRLVVAARRTWSVALLTGGAAALLAADVWYALVQLDGGHWQPGNPAELGYLLLYASWGAAALHPSMRSLTEPVDTWPTRLPARRAALLTVSLAVPSVLLLVQSVTGQLRDTALLAVASLLMLLLVMTRLTDAITRYRRSLVRERTLREVGCALVVAADVAQVRRAARAAVGDLLPPGQPYEVVIVDGGRLPAVATDRRTRLIDTALLDPAMRDEVAHCEAALICPLFPENEPTGEEAGAALVVAGRRAILVTTRNAVEVLAAQAALALERVALTETMNRRDSDEYLRAVVQNATDVVIIIDENERIRYASPSLAAVLGVSLALRHTMHELADPRDHDQISRTMERARLSRDTDGVRDVWSLRRPDGSRVTVEVAYRDLRADRMVRGFVVTMHDVTERRRIEQQLLRRALEASPGGKNRQSSARKFD
jgi:PAS domain S-box-containing protein